MKIKINIIIIMFFILLILTGCSKDHKKLKEANKNIIIEAYNNHINSTYFKVEGNGVIKSSLITQNLKVVKERDSNNLYYFNASFGSKLGIKVNNYVLASGGFEKLTLTKGETNKELETTKETYSEDINHNEFINLYGVGINSFNYIINNDTIIDIKEDVTRSNSNKFIVSLDLNKSTENYKKQISETNPYKNDINKLKFNKIELIIELDNNNHFKEITYYEEYEVSVHVLKWIKQTLKAEIKETYTYEKKEG